MAITNSTITTLVAGADATVTWAAIPNGNQGSATPAISWRRASFAVIGTFGVGGSISLQGSNDGLNWYALTPTALTVAGFFAGLGVTEHPQFIRPAVTAGDGTTALTVVGRLS